MTLHRLGYRPVLAGAGRCWPVPDDVGELAGMLSCREVAVINPFLSERWPQSREEMRAHVT